MGPHTHMGKIGQILKNKGFRENQAGFGVYGPHKRLPQFLHFSKKPPDDHQTTNAMTPVRRVVFTSSFVLGPLRGRRRRGVALLLKFGILEPRGATTASPVAAGSQSHRAPRGATARLAEASPSPHRSHYLRISAPSISALSRHRRRHAHCAGMGVPVLKMTASLRGGHFEYRHAHTRATDLPSAMPR